MRQKRKHKKSKEKKKQEHVFLDNERLQYLLSATSAVIYTANPSGDYGATFISDNVTKMVGYKPEDFLEDSTFWLNHVHPEDRKYVLAEVKKIIREKKYAFEYRFCHKNGNYIWVRDEMRLVRDKKGKPKEIIGYWTDITEKKQMEEAVQESSERLKKFMDSATEGFILFDSQLNIIDVNNYLLKTSNINKKDIIGKNMLDISFAAWESGRYDRYMKVIESGKPCFIDDVVPPSRYGDRHLSLKAFKVGDGLGMIVRDISAQKQAQEKLRESEERFRTLYESVRAGVIVQDAYGEIIHFNRTACNIFGVTEDQIRRTTSFEPFKNVIDEAGKKVPDRENPFMITRRSGKAIRNTTVGIFPDDFMKLRWLLINSEPILDLSTGKLDEVIITFIDITELKEVEKALRESEERYRHIFEQSPIGVGIATLDGKVITANKAMQDITGYTLEGFRKINLADMYENRKDREHLLKTVKKHDGVTNYKVRLKHKDGTPYDALLSITRISIGGKDFFHTICQVITGPQKPREHPAIRPRGKRKTSKK